MKDGGAERAGDPDAPLTAGAMLRAARERQGMHIAVLAASIKVSPRKLDALERDQHDELPDATFVRALAQTVCRALKIDAQPVLARLPQAGSAGFAQIKGGLNTPFRERPGRAEPGLPLPQRPLVWAGVALLAAAGAVLMVPTSTWRSLVGGDGAATVAALPAPVVVAPVVPATPASAVPAVAETPLAETAAPVATAASSPASAPLVETVFSAPADAPAAVVSQRGASIVTSEPSWIEALDGGGQVLLSRVVLPGEAIGLDGRLPLRLKIGNSRATQLVFRGQPVDLAAASRDNIARVELK